MTLPAIRFHTTKPQPGSSFDCQVEQPKPIRFSISSPLPQRGQVMPRFLRWNRVFSGGRSRRNVTVRSANSAMSFMKASRLASPRSISSRRCSHLPVSSGLVSSCWSSRSMTWMPFCVGISRRPSRMM